MSDFSREQYSKAIFGTKDAIDIFGVVSGFSIDPLQTFTMVDVKAEFIDQSAINEAAVRRNLSKLEDIHAIERVETSAAAYTWQRRESPLWDYVDHLVNEVIDRSLEA